jgi:hypothetical protein
MHDEYYSIDIPGLFCRKFFLSVGRPRRPNENFHASPPMRAQDNLLCVVENYRCRSHVFTVTSDGRLWGHKVIYYVSWKIIAVVHMYLYLVYFCQWSPKIFLGFRGFGPRQAPYIPVTSEARHMILLRVTCFYCDSSDKSQEPKPKCTKGRDTCFFYCGSHHGAHMFFTVRLKNFWTFFKP